MSNRWDGSRGWRRPWRGWRGHGMDARMQLCMEAAPCSVDMFQVSTSDCIQGGVRVGTSEASPRGTRDDRATSWTKGRAAQQKYIHHVYVRYGSMCPVRCGAWCMRAASHGEAMSPVHMHGCVRVSGQERHRGRVHRAAWLRAEVVDDNELDLWPRVQPCGVANQ